MKLALFFLENPHFSLVSGNITFQKDFWFLILFSEKKNEIPEGFYFRGENNMFVFQNQMSLQIGKNFCNSFNMQMTIVRSLPQFKL